MSARTQGLRAVERVREVREQDSRTGLQRALRDLRHHQQRVEELRHRMQQAASFATGATGSYLAKRASLELLGSALSEAENAQLAAYRITESARAHWHADRTRLRTITMLIERREAEERAERARAEAQALDELALQGWLRRNGSERGERR